MVKCSNRPNGLCCCEPDHKTEIATLSQVDGAKWSPPGQLESVTDAISSSPNKIGSAVTATLIPVRSG